MPVHRQMNEEGDAMMRDAFGPHHARLVALKNSYDPTNLFRLNQNIAPSSFAGAGEMEAAAGK